MKVGIDLLWVRPGKNGGTESCIRNILDGFSEYAGQQITYYLYVSEDNAESFEKYFACPGFVKRVCPVNTASQTKRILWENRKLGRLGQKDALDVWFMPVYSRPFRLPGKIPVVTVIHDIQAAHYPEYFSFARNLFFRLSWRRDVKTSRKIVTISEFCKDDIRKRYGLEEEDIAVVYDPVRIEKSETDFGKLEEKYDISAGEYFYTVSSLAKHKNLRTLFGAMRRLKEQGNQKKLVVTGVSVNAKQEIEELVTCYGLEQTVVFTGFISDSERDALYENCYLFVFPSVFEGFGMPPVETLSRGIPTLTTKMASLLEVTKGLASYVEDPFDEEEWAAQMGRTDWRRTEPVLFETSTLKFVSDRYNAIFEECAREKER